MSELLLYNGVIHTLDPHRSSVEAVHIQGERITFVGNEAAAKVRSSPSAKRIDLQGRTVIPGFNDNHLHLIGLGEHLSRPNLRGMNARQIVEFLKESCGDAQPGQILYASGWDYPSCPDPHRRILDEAFPENPVVLIQFSGHGTWVNSRVLEKHRIGPKTPDPEGGEIQRDGQGVPTGILRDTAALPIHRALFSRLYRSKDLQRGLLEHALEELPKAGITSVQDNTWYPATLGLLNRYRRDGRLPVRVSCWFFGMKPALATAMRLHHFDDLWVRRGLWKHIVDGTFSTRTAWLLEPYAGADGEAPENYGIATGVAENIQRYLSRSVRKRRQAAFHAIGDRTTRELINTVETLSRRYKGIADLRLRIEHAQLIDPRDIPRLAELGILVSAQPSALATPEKDVDLLGEERARRAYPYRSLLDAGVHLSFGSDMPGEASFNPLLGIHHAVNRSGPERISAAEALRCYTLGSAYAEFQESQKGSITSGKLADLTVLSENPLCIEPEAIKDIRVQMTIVGGKIVYQKEGVWPFTNVGS
ncbi:MAG: amidohydrolase [Spirochaetaceae bacterium]|nr:MAG: amidohydrolase [Spirochaetaceae bacterium]